jgi:hypothetical protein
VQPEGKLQQLITTLSKAQSCPISGSQQPLALNLLQYIAVFREAKRQVRKGPSCLS